MSIRGGVWLGGREVVDGGFVGGKGRERGRVEGGWTGWRLGVYLVDGAITPQQRLCCSFGRIVGI